MMTTDQKTEALERLAEIARLNERVQQQDTELALIRSLYPHPTLPPPDPDPLEEFYQQEIASLTERLAALQERYDCNTAIMHARTESMNRNLDRATAAESAFQEADEKIHILNKTVNALESGRDDAENRESLIRQVVEEVSGKIQADVLHYGTWRNIQAPMAWFRKLKAICDNAAIFPPTVEAKLPPDRCGGDGTYPYVK